MPKNILKQQQTIFDLVQKEEKRQKKGIQLIASESECPAEIRKLVGSVLTNKYAEGYPGKRYYTGNQFIDEIETIAIDAAKKLFGAEHANVQPHSGATANTAAYLALLNPGDTILSLRLDHGGHLSHGHPKNISGIAYNFVHYDLDPKTETIDWNNVDALAKKHKPNMILAGFTAYPRTVDFERMASIAKKYGGYSLADISHISGLVAAGVHPSPVPHCDIVTTTTQKTLNGPRGAIIMCKQEHAKKISSAVFPGLQGGPLEHVIAGKAWALLEAQKPVFKKRAKQIVKNAQAMAKTFSKTNMRLVSGGTDTHLILLDLSNTGISGKDAANVLASHDIYTNYNLIPNDPNPPMNPSGLRIGTAWITSRGYNTADSKKLAQKIIDILCV